MGHLINPIGQRMGFANYWALNSQFFFDFNTLASNSKFSFFFKTVIHDSLRKITELTSNFLDGILVSSSVNFFGFRKTKCLLDFTLFDYMFAVFFFDGFYFAHLKRLKKLTLKIKNFYSSKKKIKRSRLVNHPTDVGLTKKMKKLIILKNLTKLKTSFFNKKFLNLRFKFIKAKLLQKLLKKKKSFVILGVIYGYFI